MFLHSNGSPWETRSLSESSEDYAQLDVQALTLSGFTMTMNTHLGSPITPVHY